MLDADSFSAEPSLSDEIAAIVSKPGPSTVLQLRSVGQSPWLDFVRRDFLLDGKLTSLVVNDGVSGLISNPSMFQQALTDSDAYDVDVMRLAHAGYNVQAIYEALTVTDIQMAADILRPVFDATRGAEGFVSLEVAPSFAHDVDGTLQEVQRLVRLVDRPNLMIQVPATDSGILAFRQLTAAGISVNMTFIFGLSTYAKTLNAYMEGLEQRLEQGQPIGSVASVASFFISEIDVAVDVYMDQHLNEQADLLPLQGKIAIANAHMAYAHLMSVRQGAQWTRLEAKGAQPQRLLWASTGTKDTRHSDVVYVEGLIAPYTVNAMPLDTLQAFRSHGRVAMGLSDDPSASQQVLEQAQQLGIDLAHITQQLVMDGIQRFEEVFLHMSEAVETKRHQLLHPAEIHGSDLIP